MPWDVCNINNRKKITNELNLKDIYLLSCLAGYPVAGLSSALLIQQCWTDFSATPQLRDMGLATEPASFMVAKCLWKYQASHVHKSRCVAEQRRTFFFLDFSLIKTQKTSFLSPPWKTLSNFTLMNYANTGTWALCLAESHSLIDFSLGYCTNHRGISETIKSRPGGCSGAPWLRRGQCLSKLG